MLNFDALVKNSDATQPRVKNVKTPIFGGRDPGPLASGQGQWLGSGSFVKGLTHRVGSQPMRCVSTVRYIWAQEAS